MPFLCAGTSMEGSMLTSNNCYPPWLAQDECLVSQVFGCSSLCPGERASNTLDTRQPNGAYARRIGQEMGRGTEADIK
jgi:hypothetical protein